MLEDQNITTFTFSIQKTESLLQALMENSKEKEDKEVRKCHMK